MLFKWPSNGRFASLCLLKVDDGGANEPLVSLWISRHCMSSIMLAKWYMSFINSSLPHAQTEQALLAGKQTLTTSCWLRKNRSQLVYVEIHRAVDFSVSEWLECWKFLVVCVNSISLRRRGGLLNLHGWERSRCSSPVARLYETYSSRAPGC